MLDFDLAELYETETKYLKRSVKQNIFRFPHDFMFELTKDEWENLRCNFSTSSWGGSRYIPFAFTEQGVAMLSSVLKSKKAVEVNISIMRVFAFVRLYALTHKDLTERLDKLESLYNRQFQDVYEALKYLMEKEKIIVDQSERKRIGYKTDGY